MPREHTGHSKHPLPTTQEKTTRGHHQMVNIEVRLKLKKKEVRLNILFAAKDGEALTVSKNKTRS